MTIRIERRAKPKKHKRRRRTDRYQTLLQRVVLAGASMTVLYGQAEMLGEPWRHWLAIGGLVALVGVAFWMKET